MNKPVNVGLVGCGYWGINYIRVFSELADSHVVVACDTDSERLALVRRRFPSVKVVEVSGQMLGDTGIEAVVVATPTSTHYEIAKECLQCGKHVLVEKPLTTNVGAAEELVNLARKTGKTLMVGHTYLYNPGILKMKECMSKDDFGEVYYLHATRTHLGLIRRDVNAIWDLAPHDISIFSFLLDMLPSWVSATGGRFLNNEKEDVGFITLGYPNGVIGNIHVSWIDSNKVREVVVVGSKKRIVFDDLNALEKIRIFEKGIAITGESNSFGEFQQKLRDGDIFSPRIDAGEPLKNQCRHFLDCICRGQTPLTDGVNGLAVVRVMCAVDRSLAQDGQAVSIGG